MFSRRKILAAGFAAPILAKAYPSAAADPVAACRANLARLFPNALGAARALGAACHRNPDIAMLLDELCPGAEEQHRLACASVDELSAMLAAKIRADFVEGRTRRLDGWVLSETEARLFAILAA